MCRCSEPITNSECNLLRKLQKDSRFFIYYISRIDNKLKVALIPKGSNPNEIALSRDFVDLDNNPEWYNINEHPCLLIN